MNKQRKPFGTFDEFRQLYFENLADDKAKLFNFFFEHNHIFQFINNDDFNNLAEAYATYKLRTSLATLASFPAIFIADRTLFKNVQRWQSWRPLVFTFKYIAFPLTAYKLTKEYFNRDVETKFIQASDRYRFGYYDYNRAMDILERAHRVNRLDELMEKGSVEFDWTNVPEYKSKYVDD